MSEVAKQGVDAADPVFKRHVARLRSSLSAHSPDTICDFITQHTYLKGQKFSMRGHEYQKKILEDPAQNIVILKSAQIGISEMSARLALARSVLINGFSTIYTLPSASAAQSFMKTRIDPVVASSPYLSEMVSKAVDNSSVKCFGESYLYLKGCQVDRQAISVPADMLIADEVDNSDQDVMTLFESRLIHSAYALTVKLSTPTVPGYGIDVAYKQSKRKLNLCKCTKCNEWFYPGYYEHVKIPAFEGELSSITKLHFADPKFLWMQAYVACPKCHAPADLSPENREWVCENPDDAFNDSGYRISPFDCPTIIKPSALVRSSVDYERPQDFQNQRLGKPAEDSETALANAELDEIIVREYAGGGYSRVMGVDLGMTCWVTVADVMYDNSIVVIHVEGVPLQDLRRRLGELEVHYKVRMTVIDSLPYTETVYQIQQRSKNVFAAVYVQSKSIELFRVKDEDENKDIGKMDLRQVNIARDRGFDLVMAMVRSSMIQKVSDKYDDMWKIHMTDQKRIKVFRNGEMVFTWVKTQGQDHLAHSLLYTLVASRILGVSSGAGIPLPPLSSFKVKQA